MIIKLLVICACLFLVGSSEAAWNGPIRMLSMDWGDNQGQLKREYSDSGDVLPMGFCVTSSQYIVVADDLNSRVQIFKPDGTFKSLFGPKSGNGEILKEQWPLGLGCFTDSIFTELGGVSQIYDLNGNLIKNWDYFPSAINNILINDNFITTNRDGFYKYSKSGQLLQTYPTKPLELGDEVSFDNLNDGNYKAVVKFDDITYGFKISSEIKDFVRDAGGNLNVLFNAGSDAIHYKINKYNKCGKIISSLDLPDDVYDEDTENEFAIESYSKPVITYNSDVYVAKIADNYSILKWTWQDEPNMQSGPEAPPTIRIKSRTSGIFVRWDLSPQDPGCVSGYEISRSDTSEGLFTVLQTVESGKTEYKDTSAIAGKTYYYKIRAISGGLYSPYTAEISGK